MRRLHLVTAALAFILCLISAYYGAAIYNANNNYHIQHLNQLDNISYYSIEDVPFLTFKAAFLTVPFIVIILVLETIVALRSKIRQVKNISRGLVVAMLITLGCALLMLKYPREYDFSQWGYVWIIMGFLTVAGNMISVFIRPRNVPQ
jgi:uncharacterized membrane protein